MKYILLSFCAFFATTLTFAQTDEERRVITNSYDIEAIAELKQSLQEINKNKELLIKAYLENNPNVKRKFTDNERVFEIVDIIDGNPIYIATDNALAAAATKTDRLYPGGELGLSLEGENMIVGVWDENRARKTHVEFQDDATPSVTRVSTPDQLGPIGSSGSHATHVSGTVIAKGVNSNSKGMAPKATLLSYDWSEDQSEVITEAANGLLISNHSYGVPIFNNSGTQQAPDWMMGCYNSDAKSWDDVAVAAPYYLAVMSAGNEGASNYSGGLAIGYDKLTGEKNSKNNLVVANANPTTNIAGEITFLTINGSSSQGPSDDGRVKPDIAGDGTNLYSTNNFDDNSYATMTGTSMASPNVAGSLILLQEHYNNENSAYMRSSTLKGLVCHTARDDNKIGPDPKFGWGLLDAAKAAETITKNSIGEAIIEENTLTQGGTYSFDVTVDGTEPLMASICWIDPAGTPQTFQLNSETPALVNDLDIRISDASGTEYLPWKLQLSNVAAAAIKGDNIVDNVERVDISAPAAGTYTVTVSHKAVLNGFSQEYSLIVTGGNLTLGTDDFSVDNFKVWPNPASEVVNIQFTSLEGNADISLFDMHGRKVYQNSANSTNLGHTINVKDFSAGVYFLNIQNGTQTFNQKIVVE